MALALESVFRPPEASMQEPPRRRPADSGSGEGFANALSLSRESQAEDETSAARDAGPRAAVIPPLPADTGVGPSLAQDELAGLAPASEPPASTPPVPGADFAVADTGELETDRERALSNEETVQTAPPPLVAAANAQTPSLVASAETDAPSAPAETAPTSIQPTAAQQGAAEIANAESSAMAVAAAVAGPQNPVMEDAAQVVAPDATITDKAPTTAHAAKHRDTDGVDAPQPVPVAATSDAALVAPAVSDTPAQTSLGATTLAVAAPGPSAILTTTTPIAVPAAMTPTNALVVASPSDVVNIISSAAADGQSDSIVVQLDPPELGRISIDFKFDAHGLQHVTVTGESPEAMRQLRLMHFELTQALERHGIGSQNMTFQQQQQNAQHMPTPNPFARQGILSDAGALLAPDTLTAANSQPSPRIAPGGRLDLKL